MKLNTEIYKGFKVSFANAKNISLVFITDITDGKRTIDPSGTDFKTKDNAYKYAKLLINREVLKIKFMNKVADFKQMEKAPLKAISMAEGIYGKQLEKLNTQIKKW